jgi:hypothetical protein
MAAKKKTTTSPLVTYGIIGAAILGVVLLVKFLRRK